MVRVESGSFLQTSHSGERRWWSERDLIQFPLRGYDGDVMSNGQPVTDITRRRGRVSSLQAALRSDMR